MKQPTDIQSAINIIHGFIGNVETPDVYQKQVLDALDFIREHIAHLETDIGMADVRYREAMEIKQEAAEREAMLADAFEIIDLRKTVSNRWQALAWSSIGTAFSLLITLAVLLWP